MSKSSSKPLPSPATNSLPPGSLLKRLIALIYDGLLIAAMLMAVTAINLGIFVGLDGTEGIKEQPRQSLGPLHFPSLWLSLYLFYAFFWVKLGQTLGMQAWRLQVVGEDGNTIGWKQSFIRFLAGHVTWALGGLGYAWAFVDSQKRSLHDVLSKTRVVQLPKD